MVGGGLEPAPPAAVQAPLTPADPRTTRATAPMKPALMYMMGSLCSYRLRSSAYEPSCAGPPAMAPVIRFLQVGGGRVQFVQKGGGLHDNTMARR